MKKILLTLGFVGITLGPAQAALIFSDNFNAPDTNNLDLSDQTGRRSGLDSAIQVRSSRVQHGIVSGQLDFLSAGTGRVRFHNDPDNSSATAGSWHDWATGPGASSILADGGIRVQFEWIAGNNTSQNWVAFNIGHSPESVPEPAFRVNEASNDLGILFRFSGATQTFKNGIDAAANGTFPATLGSRNVTIDYRFNSFADGSNVNVNASLNGTNAYTGAFQWNGNGGALFMELETLENTRINSFSVSSIPEPSAPVLAALCAGTMVLRRRRR